MKPIVRRVIFGPSCLKPRNYMILLIILIALLGLSVLFYFPAILLFVSLSGLLMGPIGGLISLGISSWFSFLYWDYMDMLYSNYNYVPSLIGPPLAALVCGYFAIIPEKPNLRYDIQGVVISSLTFELILRLGFPGTFMYGWSYFFSTLVLHLANLIPCGMIAIAIVMPLRERILIFQMDKMEDEFLTDNSEI